MKGRESIAACRGDAFRRLVRVRTEMRSVIQRKSSGDRFMPADALPSFFVLPAKVQHSGSEVRLFMLGNRVRGI